MQRVRRSPQEQVRLDGELTALCEELITFNRTLGLKVDSLDPATGPRLSFSMRDELVGHFLYGQLHGGVISAVLDATGGIALMVASAEKHNDENTEQVMARFARVGTIDLRVDYLRRGIGQRFHASAQVTRLGGRIGSTQMRLENETGELIATGAAAYVLS